MAKTENTIRMTGLDKVLQDFDINIAQILSTVATKRFEAKMAEPLKKAENLHLKGQPKPVGTKQKTAPRGTGEILGAIRSQVIPDRRGLHLNTGFSISALGKDKWGYYKGLRVRFINTGTKVSGNSNYKSYTGRKDKIIKREMKGTPLIEPQYYIYYSYKSSFGNDIMKTVEDILFEEVWK